MGSPTFPGVDPNQISRIRALVSASQGDTSGIPAAPPDVAQPAAPASPLPPTSPFDVASIVRNIAQIPEYSSQSQKLSDIGAQEKDIQGQMAAEPVPKMGFQPAYQKGHFLHNLGQALLALAASTRPGQAVQETLYGPGIERYQTKQKNLAAQLASLKEQEAVPTEQLRALTGLAGAASLGAYRGGELDVKNKLAEVAQQKADTYSQSVQNTFSLGLKNLDIRSLLAGSTVELNKARQLLDTVMAQTLPQRLELQKYGIDANNATRQAVSNAMSQLGMDKTHPVAQMIDSLLGTTLTPAAPITPGGAQPAQSAKPLPPQSDKSKPKGKRVISF